MEETLDLSKINFEDDKTYGFLKIKNEKERKEKYEILLNEAKRRKQAKVFKSKVKELSPKEPTVYEVTNKGIPLKIWENLKVLYDSKGIDLQYNELKKTIESNHTWYIYEDFLTEINSYCKRSGLSLSKDELWGFTSYIANRKAYNPVKTYLEYAHKRYTEAGNKESELSKLLGTITYSKDCTKEDKSFNDTMLLMWLMTGVKMGLNDGLQNSEFALVLKGPQGLGKTRWTRSLMPKEHLTDFFKDGVQLDLSNKDDIMQSTAYWLCELGELGGTMKKSDRDALKAWITSPQDEFRTPYSRKSEKYPRRTFFACTVNDDQFLRDDTGSRRFVVLEVEELQHDHTIDVDLLWGEIMDLFLKGGITYMTADQIKFNDKRNKGYIVKTDDHMLLEEYLPFNQPEEQWGYVTCTGICNYMEDIHRKIVKPRNVGKALKAMGITQEYIRLQGDRERKRYYKLPHLEGESLPM